MQAVRCYFSSLKNISLCHFFTFLCRFARVHVSILPCLISLLLPLPHPDSPRNPTLPTSRLSLHTNSPLSLTLLFYSIFFFFSNSLFGIILFQELLTWKCVSQINAKAMHCLRKEKEDKNSLPHTRPLLLLLLLSLLFLFNSKFTFQPNLNLTQATRSTVLSFTTPPTLSLTATS